MIEVYWVRFQIFTAANILMMDAVINSETSDNFYQNVSHKVKTYVCGTPRPPYASNLVFVFVFMELFFVFVVEEWSVTAGAAICVPCL
jgi:hypothetical protein